MSSQSDEMSDLETEEGTNNFVEPKEPDLSKRAPKKYKNLIVVPEWDQDGLNDASPFNNIDNSDCIARFENIPNDKYDDSYFDQLKLMRLKELQKDYFKIKRIQKIKDGGSWDSHEYTDADIWNEMEETYGDLDRTSEHCQAIFKTYKESFLEQVKDCEKEEETQILEHLKVGLSIIDPEFDGMKQLLKKRNQCFTSTELELYTCLCPTENTSKAEWLLLPRPKDQDGWGKDALESCISNKIKHPSAKIALKLPALDPKYTDFPRYTEQDRNGYLTPKLLYRLNDKIHEFPRGIIDSSFWTEFQKGLPYHFESRTVGYRDRNEMAAELKDVFYLNVAIISPVQEMTMFFPSSFNGVILPLNTILSRFRHLILCLLGLSKEGFVKLKDIEKQLFNYFKFDLNYQDWGFEDFHKFVSEVIMTYDFNNIMLELVDLTNQTQNNFTKSKDPANHSGSNKTSINTENLLELCVWYLARKEKEVIKAFKPLLPRNKKETDAVAFKMANLYKLKFPIEMTKRNVQLKNELITVPDCMMNYYDRLDLISDILTPGDGYQCLLTAITSPSMIYAVLDKYCRQDEEFYDELQDSYWNHEYPTHSEFLKFGMPVIVYAKIDTLRARKRFRGKILCSISDDLYKILLIDEGTTVNETKGYIKYMPIEMAEACPGQAILCELKFGHRYFEKFQKEFWPLHYKNVLNSICGVGHAYVKLHSKSKQRLTNDTRWQVTVSILDPSTKNVIIPDLAYAFEDALVKSGLANEEELKKARSMGIRKRHITKAWNQTFR